MCNKKEFETNMNSKMPAADKRFDCRNNWLPGTISLRGIKFGL